MKKLLLAFFLCLASQSAWAVCGVAAGTCFVVAAGGNSNATSTWSSTSGGSTCTCVPASSDAVILDSLAGQLTINAALTVASFDASGTGGSGSPYTNTLTHNSNIALTINTGVANSLQFSTQMTYSPASNLTNITFTHTSGTAGLTTSGKILASVNINGIGGTTQLQDNLIATKSSTSYLVVNGGTLDANGKTITVNGMQSPGSSTRAVILGGDVTIGDNNSGDAPWSFTSTGLTFTKNSSNIIITTTGGRLHSFIGGGLTYNDLTITASSSSSTAPVIQFSGNNTFAHMIVGAGNTISLQNATTQTIQNAFTWVGTPAQPIVVYSTQQINGTLSVASGTSTLTWGTLSGISASGGGTFTATNVLDGGFNSGWSISAPSVGGGGHIIGGWLLKRDVDHDNDNNPVWLREVA